jgi:glycosyltransferase involved in cell wall biosynthesis
MTGEVPPLRVAFVLGLAAGGTARHVAALAHGCRVAGLAVSIIAPPPTLALLGADTGIETFALSISERPRPASDAAAVARLRKRLASWRPDVVHAHGMRAGAFAGLAMTGLAMTGPAGDGLAGTGLSGRGLRHPAARRRRAPALAVTVHNAPPAGHRSRLVYGVLERICARRADLVLCASQDLAARMRDLGAAEVERFDVPAAVTTQPSPADVARARDDVGAGDRPVVLAAGRLAQQKGLDVLIEAAGRWRHRDPQPRTVIAGDGPLAAALRAQASRAQADVLLLGPRDDVPALLEIADVVVVPSRWEARALILQEAMRSGKAIVATSVGGTPDLVGGEGAPAIGASREASAVLIPPDDPAALAAAVTAVLDNPGLAARLRLAARAQSTTFPPEEEAVKLAMSVYARLAASRSTVK